WRLANVVGHILAKDGRVGAGAGGGEVFGLALERGGIGGLREASSAPALVGARQRSCIEIRADQAFRGARLLDLGDQGIVSGSELVHDGSDKSAWGRARSGVGLDRGKGTGALGRRDLFALVGLYPGENVGHRGYSVLGFASPVRRHIA